MRQKLQGSITVEAALLYPFLLFLTFLLVKLTLSEYEAAAEQAAGLYRAVFTERELQAPELVRASDTIFDFFD
ncbi:MAG: hypothetical protein J1E35_06315 [Lachnospiraceae bacterium]|nr:hypothetical protein [Lachnospiraceae bacterium]